MLLIVVSFLSGLATILSPCIWPVLPIIFSFSAGSRSKMRPLGITLGIVVSFTFLTLTLSLLVRSLGISPNIFRYVAVFVVSFFGLTLIYPTLGAKVEVVISQLLRFTNRYQPQKNGTFTSGFLTGLSLGALWTPCAGPILATVVTLAAAGQLTINAVLITTSYVVGVSIPLFLFSLFGQYLFARLQFVKGITPQIQKIFGVVMIATAVLILFNVDTLIQTSIVNTFPTFNSSSINPENSPLVRDQLNSLKGYKPTLNTSTPAPEFSLGNNWLNTKGPLSLAALKGKVILVDFWTYTCINCIRTLPHVTSWYNKYKDQGFVVIGVHTPEFEFEKEASNVTKAIANFNIGYPVVQDNDYKIWNSYNNQYWPAEYLIDANGKIRHTHFGEGEYDITESAIQSLLVEAGQKVGSNLDQSPDITPHSQVSPESYLGQGRALYYYPTGTLSIGKQTFNISDSLPEHSFSYGGNWDIAADNATSVSNSVLNYHFIASKVFLVLRPSLGQKSLVNVYIDNKLTTQLTVDSDKLYTLFDRPGLPEDHVLKLEFLTPGTQAFAFTFG